MELVRLYIKQISYSHSQNQTFILVLNDLISGMKLPIIISHFDAQAIAVELEKNMIPPRPLTHDLFKNLAKTFQIKVTSVVIDKFLEGVFHAKLVCERDDETHYIDSRTSDAIAIALRFNAPIYIDKQIMDKVGIFLPNIEDDEMPISEPISEKKSGKYDKYSVSELQKMLNDCIENEDYELAAKIRDEISKRENNTR